MTHFTFWGLTRSSVPRARVFLVSLSGAQVHEHSRPEDRDQCQALDGSQNRCELPKDANENKMPGRSHRESAPIFKGTET